MTAIDTALADELIASHLDILRLEAGLRARVLDILTRLQRELVAELANAGELTDFTKARVQELLRQVAALVDNYYQRAQGEAELTLAPLPQTMAAHVAGALDTHVAIDIGASLPPPSVLQRMAANSLIDGGPLAEWWQRLSMDTAFRLSNAIRQGIAQGETTQQIVARIIGTRTQPGIMDIARRNAAAVVQTAAMTVANDARLQTLQKNADVVKGLQWLTALDSRVCFAAGSAVLMADGSAKAIESVLIGDLVVGGLSKTPVRVIATQSRNASTVVIHSNSGRVVRCTPDHLFMTDHGWIEARDLVNKRVLAYVPKRQAVHRINRELCVALATALRGQFGRFWTGAQRWAARCIRGNQEVRRRHGHDARAVIASNAGGGRGAGEALDCRFGDVLSAWLQHDGGRRGCSGVARTYSGGNGREALISFQDGPGIRCEDARRNQIVRPEGRQDSKSVQRNARGAGDYQEAHEFSVERENNRHQQTAAVCGNLKTHGGNSEGAMGRPGASGKGECCTRCESGSSEIHVSVYATIDRIEEAEATIVYDIEVGADEHSFVCEGFVVHNCMLCAARADLAWKNDADHTPIGHSLPFQNPPIHFNDRCLLVPITKTFAEMGSNLPEPRSGERAAEGGPVPASTTFAQWLARRTPEQQDEQLGPGRAQLWRDGHISLQQLLALDGNPLTMAQLQAKYGP